jgi:hypothetical protein
LKAVNRVSPHKAHQTSQLAWSLVSLVFLLYQTLKFIKAESISTAVIHGAVSAWRGVSMEQCQHGAVSAWRGVRQRSQFSFHYTVSPLAAGEVMLESVAGLSSLNSGDIPLFHSSCLCLFFDVSLDIILFKSSCSTLAA